MKSIAQSPFPFAEGGAKAAPGIFYAPIRRFSATSSAGKVDDEDSDETWMSRDAEMPGWTEAGWYRDTEQQICTGEIKNDQT